LKIENIKLKIDIEYEDAKKIKEVVKLKLMHQYILSRQQIMRRKKCPKRF